MRKKTRANFLLLLASFIWGMAFVAQKKGLSCVEPFTFNGIRTLLGGLVLLPLLPVLDKKGGAVITKTPKWPWLGGICCGVCMFVATSLQQIGLLFSDSVGKAGFVTALYIVIVPICGIFMKKRVSLLMWLSVLIATLGMYLLCVKEGFRVETADIYVFLSAVVYAVHILLIDYFAPRGDGVRMSCLQFFVCGGLSLLTMVFFETPTWQAIWSAAIPILYAGALSCSVAYTLQIVAQKDTDPASAALLCSMESVFALLGGWMLMGERLSFKELFGCALTFCAIILSQSPSFNYKQN